MLSPHVPADWGIVLPLCGHPPTWGLCVRVDMSDQSWQPSRAQNLPKAASRVPVAEGKDQVHPSPRGPSGSDPPLSCRCLWAPRSSLPQQPIKVSTSVAWVPARAGMGHS